MQNLPKIFNKIANICGRKIQQFYANVQNHALSIKAHGTLYHKY